MKLLKPIPKLAQNSCTYACLDLRNDFQTNDLSDYRPAGLLTIRTSERCSDQWTVGLTNIRNIEPSPSYHVAGLAPADRYNGDERGTSHDFIWTCLATTCLNRCINHPCKLAYKLAKWKSPTGFNSSSTPWAGVRSLLCAVCQTPCALPQRDVGLARRITLWPVSLKVSRCNSDLTENINYSFKCFYLKSIELSCFFATVGLFRTAQKPAAWLHFMKSELNPLWLLMKDNVKWSDAKWKREGQRSTLNEVGLLI